MDQNIHVSVRAKPFDENEEADWEIANNSMVYCLRTKDKFIFGTL
jgi:hypothetical protein